ncbi:MAG: CHAT domain-containing protein [Hymenobacteraceae bacterium]|nr:CHAT domain-containing protein [Hymenobacteraceae bacterium]MDX5396198.1 CHAT domain-containing protein [Hymenobacteraceae bacterium]MDX5512260.1 CHAT domain-containing protein [Hymenobacteraceae bacterium]
MINRSNANLLALVWLLLLFPVLVAGAQQPSEAVAKAQKLLKQGNFYNSFNKKDSALICYEQAAKLVKAVDARLYMEGRSEQINILNSIGVTEAAHQLLKKDFIYLKQNFGANSAPIVYYYKTAAKLQVTQLNVQLALSYYKRGLRIANKTFGKNSIESAILQSLIAGIHADADTAMHYATEAVKNLHGQPEYFGNKYAANIFNSIALSLHNLSYYNDNKPITLLGRKFTSTLHASLCYYDSAYQAELQYNEFKETQFAASILHNMGISYESLVYTDPDPEITPQKLAYWQKALDFYNRSNSSALKQQYGVLPLNMVCKGIVYADMGDLNQALHWFHQGVKCTFRNFKTDDIYKLPLLENVKDMEKAGMLLEFKAKAFKDRYNKTGDLKDLQAFYNNALLLAKLLEKQRESAKLYFDAAEGPAVAAMSENYALAIEACEKLYRTTKKQEYLNEAFLIAEKFKHNTLLHLSQKDRLLQYLKGDKAAMNAYKNLSRSVKYYEQLSIKLQKYPLLKNMALFRNAHDSLNHYNTEFEAFLAKIKERYPQFYSEKVEGNYLVTLQEFQEMLPDKNTAALVYVRHHEQRQVTPNLYVFVVEKNSARFVKLTLPETFEDMTDSLVHSIFYSNQPKYKKYGHEFYNLLLAPLTQKLSSGITKLMVMPDSKLWQIPFGALLTANTHAADYRKLPYLCRKYNIHYAHTATIMQNYRQKSGSFYQADNILALAPFANDKNGADVIAQQRNLMAANEQEYTTLPYTIKLLNRLKDQFSGKFLVDSAASESYFKQHANEFSVLHLATHADADLDNPLKSKFVLAKNGAEDGELFMSELLQLNLRPHLAVLSACETGIGQIRAGSEGMLSLGWMFNYMGCPSVVSTLWKVDDRNTSSLLTTFYEHLSRGSSKDKALHLAKMQLIQNARTSEEANPFYWSGYVLIGDPAPLQLLPWYLQLVWLLTAAGATALTGVVLFLRKKKNQKKVKEKVLTVVAHKG